MPAKFSRAWRTGGHRPAPARTAPAGARLARRLATLGCLAGVTLLTACGSAQIVHAGQALAVSVGEDRVAPENIAAPTGLLQLRVHNTGRFVHDLTISRNGIIAAQTPPLAPGQGAVLDAVLAPGTYLMASTLQSDQALGAYGTIRIGR